MLQGSWDKFWFHLDGTELFSYKDETETDIQGCYSVEQFSSIVIRGDDHLEIGLSNGDRILLVRKILGRLFELKFYM